jgi:hypothetical protein
VVRNFKLTDKQDPSVSQRTIKIKDDGVYKTETVTNITSNLTGITNATTKDQIKEVI